MPKTVLPHAPKPHPPHSVPILPPTAPPLRSRCLHEALHGVILSRFLTVRSVSIRPQWYHGRVVAGLTRYDRPSPGDRAGLLGELVGTLAAAVGVALAEGSRETRWEYATGDLDHAQTILDELTCATAEQAHLMRICLAEARRLVADLWPTIERLATALKDREVLSAKDIRQVIAGSGDALKPVTKALPPAQGPSRFLAPKERAAYEAGAAVSLLSDARLPLYSVSVAGPQVDPRRGVSGVRTVGDPSHRAELVARVLAEINRFWADHRIPAPSLVAGNMDIARLLDRLTDSPSERAALLNEVFRDAEREAFIRRDDLKRVQRALLNDGPVLPGWRVRALVSRREVAAP